MLRGSIITSVIILLFLTAKAQNPRVLIYEPNIPILKERPDNVLFYIRVDSPEGGIFNSIDLNFTNQTDIKEIKSIKLYYGGTEADQRKEGAHFFPVKYISGSTGKGLAANPSYSILKDEIRKISSNLHLEANQILFPGINYFWVSIQMKPKASLFAKVQSKTVNVNINGKNTQPEYESESHQRLVGLGVRHAGDDNVAAFRIPGLVTTKENTLLAVYDVRYNSSVDLQEYIDVGLSRSTNGGKTWEKMRLPMQFGEYAGLPKAQNGVGDPAILVDEVTGTIWIVAAWTHGMGNYRAWWNSLPGIEIQETAQLVLSRSDDDGKTWSKPINITHQVKKPEWRFLLQGPGRGITTEDGTLVFASQYIAPDGIPHAGIIYSKDRGNTWHISEPARNNTTEAQIAEVEPGVLMLNMRDNRGGSRAVSITKDYGATWEEHASNRSALIEPVCMASLLHVKANDNILGKDILLFSNPNSTEHRKDITIKASLDGGLTWLEDNQITLDEGFGWGYSCLTMIDHETVGIIYESSLAHMTFQAVKLKDIIK